MIWQHFVKFKNNMLLIQNMEKGFKSDWSNKQSLIDLMGMNILRIIFGCTNRIRWNVGMRGRLEYQCVHRVISGWIRKCHRYFL